MKITLFLEDRTVEFMLPNQISGSYGFDIVDDESDKLINVEAREGKWILYSTDFSFVMSGQNSIPDVELLPNRYYSLSRNNTQYLIYVSNAMVYDVIPMTYDDNSIIKIGNSDDCSIKYSCPYLNGLFVDLKKTNNIVTLSSNITAFYYVNNIRVKTESYTIPYGSTINVYGFKLMVLPNIIVFLCPKQMVSLGTTGMQKLQISVPNYENIQVKDVDLYNRNNYFSKSPRIRRQIEEKEFNIDRPPKIKETEKTPLVLTLGPMLSLMASSGITLLNTIIKINEGSTTYKDSWMSFATCGIMILTSFIWPAITRAYNRRMEKKNNKEVTKKYTAYLSKKDAELNEEANLQKSIYNENLITCPECLSIIQTRKNNFWSKRKEQNDFLEFRAGIGKVPLKLKVNYPKEGFTLEEDHLKKMADDVFEKYKILNDIPVGYSLYENNLTAVMGPTEMAFPFVNNMLLQLMTFYCYDELKFIVFTNGTNRHNWEYLLYSNYLFSNNKDVRYFASTDEEYKNLSDYLNQELQYRMEFAKGKTISGKEFHQYYIIICDNYAEAKKLEFFKKLVELDSNLGYSAVFIDNTLSNLPSKCVNFISLANGTSGIMKNSYESAKITEFHDEIQKGIDMKSVVNVLSNIPVEIADDEAKLPNSVGFLEMEKVGKVEQLNILNRWSSNDSTKSLKAEVGLDVDSNLMYLDLHEKFHGPHGLIAGMTGSGKSEFIITYILSLAMNFSPDDVSFALIDYKGGGLAGAFLNQATGIRLPHLAGTITNLDKAEMNRTLVSIDSEVKRRQKLFNEARDALAESTIDIYKYQGFYHQGKVKEPIPHLFIICDEFAELKSQQPDFMDNLISVARIGRSLGVHLILATQKPSGVVNDQIWSNSKFRVCLKVQDASDSNEMLKRPDAANLKQTGRFYLQVGYDEYFALGQSAWSGAKYFPADKPPKNVDKSLQFINTNGVIIKTVEDDSQKKKESQGEQISAVIGEIINVAKQTNKYARNLWLESIPNIILVDNLIKKYNVNFTPYQVEAIVGEYDAPELQEQGLVKYNLVKNGNTILFGTDGPENENLVNSMIYSMTGNYSAEEVNIYAIDYGSESMRIFQGLPHFGGIVTAGDEEKYTNLIKLLKSETEKRKELFINYGGEYENFLKSSGQKLPVMFIIINNIDAAKGSIQTLYDELPDMIRDSDRYGIVYLITASGYNSVGSKIMQSIKNSYCLKLKDVYDYSSILGAKIKNEPKDIPGRGYCVVNGAHEFQSASIVDDPEKLSDYVLNFVNTVREKNTSKAIRIPSLPKQVTFDDIDEAVKDLTCVPIGIAKNSLEIVKVDLLENIGNLVLSNKIDNIVPFAGSFLNVLKRLPSSVTLLVDTTKDLAPYKEMTSGYYDGEFDKTLDALIDYFNKLLATPNVGNVTLVINSLNKFASKISDTKKLEELFNLLKKSEKIAVVVFDEAIKIKQNYYDPWFKTIFNGNEGLWIGTGISEQQIFKVSAYSKEYRVNYKNDMGFFISNGEAILVKLIDFEGKGAKK